VAYACRMLLGSGKSDGDPVCCVQLFWPAGLHGNGEVLQGACKVD